MIKNYKIISCSTGAKALFITLVVLLFSCKKENTPLPCDCQAGLEHTDPLYVDAFGLHILEIINTFNHPESNVIYPGHSVDSLYNMLKAIQSSGLPAADSVYRLYRIRTSSVQNNTTVNIYNCH